ncbi:DUF3857 domain-containing protein [Moheibacter lacus]|uniref:DUF3857 domain-containing protein n=1 Tax=Moheibacter lacus TaxID=2745851 RepID=A0A838ZL98_9FLAO|nr:DUF3857 domain-containing protein [Moheibacter lacus]MBA5628510.1 DUF3857 domain-containing protein [Moheibacter lacus]
MKFLLLTLFIFPIFIQSQINPKTKWGDVSDAEINLKEVPFEKNADAVVLYESGDLTVAYQNWGNKIYKRIKILTEKGKEMADYDLIYFSLNDFESILSLNAQTINFENGKKEITPVKNKDIYDLPYSGYYRTKRFAFPNVKVGSIIELEYNLVNRFHSYMEGWVFQHEIPTLYSSLSVDVQAPVDYIPILHGERIIAESKEEKKRKNHKNHWTLTDLPSIDQPEFLYNPRDFEERIDFQLRGYHHKNGSYVNEVIHWTDINRIFKKDFVNYYDEKTTQNIGRRILNKSDEKEQIQAALEYFKTNYHWDNFTNVIPRKSLLEVDQSKKGSTSEINLLLHYVLLEKGIRSQLVLISKRKNKKLQTAYPYFNQFSSIINLITLDDGNTFLIDASQLADYGFQFMPLYNYNHIGLVVNSDKADFISVTPPLSEFHLTESYHFTEHKINSQKIEKKSGYFLDETISTNYPTQKALDIHFSETSQSPDLKLENNFISSKKQFQSENQNPNFFTFQNPLVPSLKPFNFTDAHRDKPIEFDFPMYQKIIISSKIPKGFQVVLPKDFNAHYQLGENDLM